MENMRLSSEIDYEEFARVLYERFSFIPKNLIIELTEQENLDLHNKCMREKSLLDAPHIKVYNTQYGQLNMQVRKERPKAKEVEKLIKPPIGIKPKFVWKTERLRNLSEAINRYIVSGNSVPNDWLIEQQELISELDLLR